MIRPLVGVLAVQGDVSEHAAALERSGADVRLVRRPADLDGLDGIVLPGGESTAFRRLLDWEDLLSALRDRLADGLPVFGTCAGAILLADRVEGAAMPHLATLPIRVQRNAYGRQVDSFVADLDVDGLEGGPLRAVFIRAPAIASVGPGMTVLAEVDGAPVLAEGETALVATFHPELSGDDRLHRRFVQKALASRSRRAAATR